MRGPGEITADQEARVIVLRERREKRKAQRDAATRRAALETLRAPACPRFKSLRCGLVSVLEPKWCPVALKKQISG